MNEQIIMTTAICAALIAFISLGFNVFQSIRNHRIRKHERKMTLAVEAPEVLFKWRSNYVFLRFSTEAGQPLVEPMYGVFGLINQSNTTLNEVKISIYAGYDINILKSPYDTNVKAVQICSASENQLKPTETLELDVIKTLGEKGFNIYSDIKPNDLSLVNSHKLNWGQMSREQSIFGENLFSLKGVSWDTEKNDVYGVYLRAYVEYSYRSQRIRSCLSGAIGSCTPKNKGSGSVTSTFSKSKISIHIAPSGEKTEIYHPQIVYDDTGNINDRFPSNTYINGFRASGIPNDFTMWMKIQVLDKKH